MAQLTIRVFLIDGINEANQGMQGSLLKLKFYLVL
jgi:hypothetical protein